MKRFFTIIAFALFISSAFCMAENRKTKCIRPDYLKPGDKVAIIAPSFAIYDTLKMQRACEVLRARGLEPVLSEHICKEPVLDADGKELELYPGTEDERLLEFLMAYNDPTIKAIICARGGYGGIQLLDRIPLSTYTMHPKWLVGYSDITNFLAESTRAGVMSIHGNMASSLGSEKGVNQYSEAMLNLLFGKVPEYDIAHNERDIQGKAHGILVGGNAITFQALFNTKYDFMQYDDIILFVEEVGESMHALDRFFSVLKLQGKMSHVKGIIIGSMADCGHEMDYSDIYDVIRKFTDEFGVPTSYGFECGHSGKNWPIIIGAPVTLDVTPTGSHLSFDIQ